MAVMTASPSTPQRTPGSALWPSPQFSDYFSGADDTSSPNNHADQSKDTFVIQSQIVGRLNEIARKVAGQDGQQTPNLLDFQAELSTLEARLNAPDSQTREIAEDSENGLFSDDEDDAAQLQEENQELRRKVEEGKAVVARITKLTESLKHRYEEMKVSLCASCYEVIANLSSRPSMRLLHNASNLPATKSRHSSATTKPYTNTTPTSTMTSQLLCQPYHVSNHKSPLLAFSLYHTWTPRHATSCAPTLSDGSPSPRTWSATSRTWVAGTRKMVMDYHQVWSFQTIMACLPARPRPDPLHLRRAIVRGSS